MPTTDSLAPYFFQVAYVVSDLAAAEDRFRRMLGVPYFLRMDGVTIAAGCRHRGRPANYTADLSLGYLGETQIELVRPGGGESIYTEFLARQPQGGLQHIAFVVPDFGATVAQLAAQGLEIACDGVLDTGMRVEFAYFDCEAAGASMIEILGLDERARAFMDELKHRREA